MLFTNKFAWYLKNIENTLQKNADMRIIIQVVRKNPGTPTYLEPPTVRRYPPTVCEPRCSRYYTPWRARSAASASPPEPASARVTDSLTCHPHLAFNLKLKGYILYILFTQKY